MTIQKELSLLKLIKDYLSLPETVEEIESGDLTTAEAIEDFMTVLRAVNVVKDGSAKPYDTVIPRTDKEKSALEVWKNPEKLKKMLEVIQQGIDKGTKIIDVPCKGTEVFTFNKADMAYLSAFRSVSVTTIRKITVTSLEHNIGSSEVVSAPFISVFTPEENPDLIYAEPSDDFGMVFKEVKEFIAAAYSTEDGE